MKKQTQDLLRFFIREEVWRTVSRTAGMVGGADLGGIARSGRPMWSSDPEHDEEDTARPYSIPEPEYEEVPEIRSLIDGEKILIQPKNKKLYSKKHGKRQRR